MTERKKSVTEKRIEKALSIGDDLSNLENEPTDTDEKLAAERRQKLAKELSKKLEKAKQFDDEKFVKEMLREVAEIGISVGRVLKEEAELTGEGRTAECLSSLLNSVTTAVKELQDVEVGKSKLGLEKEKIELRKIKTDNGVPKIGNGTVAMTTADLLRLMKKEEKIIDIEVEDKE